MECLRSDIVKLSVGDGLFVLVEDISKVGQDGIKDNKFRFTFGVESINLQFIVCEANVLFTDLDEFVYKNSLAWFGIVFEEFFPGANLKDASVLLYREDGDKEKEHKEDLDDEYDDDEGFELAEEIGDIYTYTEAKNRVIKIRNRLEQEEAIWKSPELIELKEIFDICNVMQIAGMVERHDLKRIEAMLLR